MSYLAKTCEKLIVRMTDARTMRCSVWVGDRSRSGRTRAHCATIRSISSCTSGIYLQVEILDISNSGKYLQIKTSRLILHRGTRDTERTCWDERSTRIRILPRVVRYVSGDRR